MYPTMFYLLHLLPGGHLGLALSLRLQSENSGQGGKPPYW